MSATRYDLADPGAREEGLAAAVTACRKGELVVLPTDTVYGVGCDAFSPRAVQALLDAKGRGRQMPPPVLVSASTTLAALGTDYPEWVTALTEHYWPGALTLVVNQQGSLRWDLGETRGTVAVRMPDHGHALELLGRTGPLAVSSANTTGAPAATTAGEAEAMLGEQVSVLLDGGPTPGSAASTIIDGTSGQPRLLRSGGVPVAELRTFLDQLGVDVGELPADA